jgi:hypothetical protein
VIQSSSVEPGSSEIEFISVRHLLVGLSPRQSFEVVVMDVRLMVYWLGGFWR